MRAYKKYIVVLIALLGTACSPAGPQSSSPSAPGPTTPIGPQPLVTNISPALGSSDGGAALKITGSGFLPTVVATFGGVSVPGRFDTRDTTLSTILLDAPAHAAGPVDVVVTNPSGFSQVLSNGFTFVSPASFDFNGAWSAASFDGSDRLMNFTITNDRVVSVTCLDSSGLTTTVAVSAAVINGAFAYSGSDGVRVSGRMVSPAEAVGTLNLALCTEMTWRTRSRVPGLAQRN